MDTVFTFARPFYPVSFAVMRQFDPRAANPLDLFPHLIKSQKIKTVDFFGMVDIGDKTVYQVVVNKVIFLAPPFHETVVSGPESASGCIVLG